MPTGVYDHSNRLKYKPGYKYGPYNTLLLERTQGRKALFRCSFCGTVFECDIYSISNGETKSCGCQNHISNVPEDLTGQKFGKLTAIKYIGYKKDKKGNSPYWLCRCDCGNEKEVKKVNLKTGHTQSCGCVNSQGELLIQSLLRKMDIDFFQQYSFEDCINPKTGCSLMFDFYLPKYNICIEYDGEQHFKSREFGIFTEENLKQIQNRDSIKNEYCKDNNIGLIRIPYTDKPYIDEKYIRSKIENA